MNRLNPRIALPVAVLVLVVLGGAGAALAWRGGSSGDDGGGAGADQGALVQRSEGGGAAVTATLVAPGNLAGIEAETGTVDLQRQTAVRLVLETHSGDLRGYDYARGARLRDGQGNERGAVAWKATNDDSHHLEGLLVFDGAPGAGEIQLTLRDLAGVPERTFRWSLTQ